jgi:CTP:molybdopterin cytidylyltransferase MocA
VKTSDVAAIVLAAGRSQRMGAFKPLLPFGGTTVIGSCIDYLEDAAIETIVVVVGHRAEELRVALKNSEVTYVENPDVGGEMSTSIACGINQLPNDIQAVLITPADLPAVPSEVVTKLITEWRNGHPLVKPTWQRRGGHPVLIDMAFRDELTRLDSDRGLKALFERHLAQVRRMPVDSNYIARDIDTWDDYAALHLEVFGHLPPQLPSVGEPRADRETN